MTNPLRMIKTVVQTSTVDLSSLDAARLIRAQSGFQVMLTLPGRADLRLRRRIWTITILCRIEVTDKHPLTSLYG